MQAHGSVLSIIPHYNGNHKLALLSYTPVKSFTFVLTIQKKGWTSIQPLFQFNYLLGYFDFDPPVECTAPGSIIVGHRFRFAEE